MDFERNACDRCTRVCYVCVLGSIRYCDHCLEAMIHNPETKNLMIQVMKQYGSEIPQLEIDD